MPDFEINQRGHHLGQPDNGNQNPQRVTNHLKLHTLSLYDNAARQNRINTLKTSIFRDFKRKTNGVPYGIRTRVAAVKELQPIFPDTS